MSPWQCMSSPMTMYDITSSLECAESVVERLPRMQKTVVHPIPGQVIPKTLNIVLVALCYAFSIRSRARNGQLGVWIMWPSGVSCHAFWASHFSELKNSWKPCNTQYTHSSLARLIYAEESRNHPGHLQSLWAKIVSWLYNYFTKLEETLHGSKGQ